MLLDWIKRIWKSPVMRTRIYFVLCGIMMAVGLLVVIPIHKGAGNAMVMVFAVIAGGLFARFRTAEEEEKELRKKEAAEGKTEKEKGNAKSGRAQVSNIRHVATQKLKDKY